MDAGVSLIWRWRMGAVPLLVVLAAAGVRLFGGFGEPGEPERSLRPTAAAAPSRPVPPSHPAVSSSAGSQVSSAPIPEPHPARHRTGESYEVWDLPPEEIAGIAAHPEEIFGRLLESASGGGVRLLDLLATPSAASRGLQARDVVLDINGTRVYKPEDLVRTLRESVRSGSRGWRILIDRQGEERVLDVRTPAGP